MLHRRIVHARRVAVQRWRSAARTKWFDPSSASGGSCRGTRRRQPVRKRTSLDGPGARAGAGEVGFERMAPCRRSVSATVWTIFPTLTNRTGLADVHGDDAPPEEELAHRDRHGCACGGASGDWGGAAATRATAEIAARDATPVHASRSRVNVTVAFAPSGESCSCSRGTRRACACPSAGGDT